MTTGEDEEGLFGCALLGISGEEAFYFGWQFGEADGRDEFAGEALILICATTDEDLVALFAGDFDAHEAEVADVMLGAGVMAAGDVKVDGLVENGEAFVEEIREGDGVALGVGG